MKNALIWIAASLMVLGAVLFTVAMFMIDFDFSKLNSSKYTTKTYEFPNETFEHIDINSITSDIEFRKSDDGHCRVVCYEREKISHEVFIENGILIISENDTRTWVDQISVFNFQTPTITIYLPSETYHQLKVENTTGDIRLNGSWNFNGIKLTTTTGDIYVTGVTATETVFVHVTTGNIQLENVTCNQLSTEGSTGDIVLTNVFAQSIRAKQTTGDITLKNCDADALNLHATTGDITATLKTEKTVIATSTTGDVNVPSNTTGGRCDVSTTTGDINIRFKN